MLAYTPAKKSLWKRALGSTLVQVMILGAVVAGVFSYVRYQNHLELSQRIAEIENAQETQLIDNQFENQLVKSDSASEGIANPSAQDAPANELALGQQEAAADLTRDGTPSRPAEEFEQRLAARFDETAPALSQPPALDATRDAGATKDSNTNAATTTPPKIRVVFTTFPREQVGEMISESRQQSYYGVVSTGVLTRFDAKTRPGIQVLDSSVAESIQLNQPIVVYKGTRDEMTGQNLGLSLHVTPTGMDTSGVQVQVDIHRLLRDPAARPPLESVNLPLPDDFLIPRGGAAFISGLLPRRQLDDSEEALYQSVNVLRILGSEAFRSGALEFVVFVESQ